MSARPVSRNPLLTRIAGLPVNGRTRWSMIALWVVLTAIAVSLAGRVSEVEDNGSDAYLPANSEALAVSEERQALDAGERSIAVIVFHRADGLTAADQEHIGRVQETITALGDQYRLSPPIPSEDGQAAIISIDLPAVSDDELADSVDELRALSRDQAPDGLETKLSGPAGIGVDLGKVFEGINGTLLLSAATVVAVLLLITYRSPVLWILPLLTVGIADRVATGLIYLLGRFTDIAVNGQSVGIMAVLVFGAGTDYALLLIARYREELHFTESPGKAMATAIREAAPAIFASGSTVMLGLACLFLAELNGNRALGPVGIIAILSSLVVTLTLLPAMLVIVGRRVFWPFTPTFDQQHESHGIWTRIGDWVSRAPRRVWIGASIALLIMAAGLGWYQISYSQTDQFTDKPEAIQGAELIAAHYPAGASAPTTVITNAAQRDATLALVEATEGVATVQPGPGNEQRVAFTVVIEAEPGTTEAFDTVQRLRTTLETLPEAEALVGGSDAESYDTDRAEQRDQQVVIPLVLAVVLLVLIALLRSIAAPILLLLTSVLSTLASVGVTVVVFRELLGYDGLQAGVVLIGFVFLIALGVDYNIFLMSRVYEETPERGTRDAMLHSLNVTGGVITSAGIVLAATFGVLGLLPLVALAQVGFLVAFGVLLDTILVRSILVPALVLDAGPRIWWPARRDTVDERTVAPAARVPAGDPS